jgi:hypothetical protein
MHTLITSYAAFLRSGASFKEAVVAALGRRQFLPDATVEALSAVHAKAYKCEARQTDSGRWTFYADDKRNEAATKAWARWVGCFHKAAKSARGGATSEQASPVSKLVTAFEKLTAAERRKFLRQIGAI